MITNTIVERIQVNTDSLYYREHEARYHFVQSFLRPGWTLDIACGSGYGSDLFMQQPSINVIGVDIDLSTLEQARQRYSNSHLNFMASNGTTLPFSTCQFENIVSLETIEHIVDDRAFLRELARVMHTEGVCILSTPNRLYTQSIQCTNPYHVREYVREEFLSLVKIHFDCVDLYYQGFSQRYRQQVQEYVGEIQTRKRELPPILQGVIDHIYRPLKQLVPTWLTNFFIGQWLHISYPQPVYRDITISRDMTPDTSVFIAVCRRPHSVV